MDWNDQAEILLGILGVGMFDKYLEQPSTTAKLTEDGSGFVVTLAEGVMITMTSEARLTEGLGQLGDKDYIIEAVGPNINISWTVEGNEKHRAIRAYVRCMKALKSAPKPAEPEKK